LSDLEPKESTLSFVADELSRADEAVRFFMVTLPFVRLLRVRCLNKKKKKGFEAQAIVALQNEATVLWELTKLMSRRVKKGYIDPVDLKELHIHVSNANKIAGGLGLKRKALEYDFRLPPFEAIKNLEGNEPALLQIEVMLRAITRESRRLRSELR